jgi:hypothetical protein
MKTTRNLYEDGRSRIHQLNLGTIPNRKEQTTALDSNKRFVMKLSVVFRIEIIIMRIVCVLCVFRSAVRKLTLPEIKVPQSNCVT